jgi:hypothetical protein
MKNLLFLSGFLLFFSCEKKDTDDNDNEQFGAYINTVLTLEVQDKAGNNLLLDSTEGYYSYEEIKTYTIDEGGKIEYLTIGLHPRKQIAYYNNGKKLYLELHLAYPGHFFEEVKVLSRDTYVQFGNCPMDKITGWFTVGPAGCNLDSAFFNDKLVYVENSNAKEEIFPIIQIEPNNK